MAPSAQRRERAQIRIPTLFRDKNTIDVRLVGRRSRRAGRHLSLRSMPDNTSVWTRCNNRLAARVCRAARRPSANIRRSPELDRVERDPRTSGAPARSVGGRQGESAREPGAPVLLAARERASTPRRRVRWFDASISAARSGWPPKLAHPAALPSWRPWRIRHSAPRASSASTASRRPSCAARWIGATPLPWR